MTDKTDKAIAQIKETQAHAQEVLAASALGEAVAELLRRGEEPSRASIAVTLKQMLQNPTIEKRTVSDTAINLALQALEAPGNT